MKGGNIQLAFNPRSKPAKVVSNAEWTMAVAKSEAKKMKPLKPLPAIIKPLKKKIDYYIELWKLGDEEEDVIAKTFSTSNIKHVLSLIVKSHYSVLYLRRMCDSRVILNKRF